MNGAGGQQMWIIASHELVKRATGGIVNDQGCLATNP
jgi:hypothetical protein